MTAIPERHRRRWMPHWRKMTWVLTLWTLLFGIWMIAAIAGGATDHAKDCGTLSQKSCDAAADVGTGIGVVLIFVLWLVGFLVLSLIWIMSRPRN